MVSVANQRLRSVLHDLTSYNCACTSITISQHWTNIVSMNMSAQSLNMRLLRISNPCRRVLHHRRTLIAAPRPGSGPLMERRADRELPTIQPTSRRWLRTLPIFLAILATSTLAIFNYQKASSSVVNSTLYALRTNPKARELLGDEIYFASKMPWIWGEMNQLHGRINIHFTVKGTRQQGTMRFRSERKTRLGYVSY